MNLIFPHQDSVVFSAGFQYRAVNISEYLCVLNAAGEQEAQDIAMHFTFSYYYARSILEDDRMLVYIFQFFCPFTQKN